MQALIDLLKRHPYLSVTLSWPDDVQSLQIIFQNQFFPFGRKSLSRFVSTKEIELYKGDNERLIHQQLLQMEKEMFG